jgi:hypothetical protein
VLRQERGDDLGGVVLDPVAGVRNVLDAHVRGPIGRRIRELRIQVALAVAPHDEGGGLHLSWDESAFDAVFEARAVPVEHRAKSSGGADPEEKIDRQLLDERAAKHGRSPCESTAKIMAGDEYARTTECVSDGFDVVDEPQDRIHAFADRLFRFTGAAQVRRYDETPGGGG